MGKIFGDVKETRPLTERESLQNRYTSARGNLIGAVVFTVINIALLFLDGSSYFLFSIFVPYFIALMGMMITGKMPEEFYGEDWVGYEFLDNSVLIVMLVIAVVILGIYLLSWIFSKKNRVGWLIFTLVIFCIDTLLMLFLQGVRESIVDIVFHGWVIVSLARGIGAYYKLKKLPEEEIIKSKEVTGKTEEAEEAEGTVEETVVQNSTHLRMADLDAKAKILLQTEKDGLAITYRRVKRVNELVVNGIVYDEYEALVENAHNLAAVVGGRTVEAGFDGMRSYIKIDGEIIAKKVRLA